jgi:hypothetical protein
LPQPRAGLWLLHRGYGRVPRYALTSAMRYVIVIAALAFFILWDGLYNDGRYVDESVRTVKNVVHAVTD